MAKRKGASLKKLIFNDKYLIVVSILLAVIVWTVTSLNIGTDETKTISIEVPIKLSDELSEQVGMQYYTLQKSVYLNVTVSGAKYVVGQVKRDDLSIKFDTSNVNKAGEQSIPIMVTNNSKTLDFTVNSFSPVSIDAYFDVEATKTFDIDLRYDRNNVAEGYVFGTPALSEEKVVVTGPKSFVDKIDRAVVEVDFGENSDLTEAFTAEAPIQIEGKGVEASYLRMTAKGEGNKQLKNVSVSLPVLKELSLPVVVSFEDEPSDFTEDRFGVRYSVGSLRAGVLPNTDVTTAVVGTVNFKNVDTGTNRFTFEIKELQGVLLLDEDVTSVEVTMTVPEKYVKKRVYLNTDDISVTGLKSNEKAQINSLTSHYITVILPEDMEEEELRVTAKCNVSDRKKDNKYRLTVSVNNRKAWVFGDYSANISIR